MLHTGILFAVFRIQSRTNVFMWSFTLVLVFIVLGRIKNTLQAVATGRSMVKRNRYNNAAFSCVRECVCEQFLNGTSTQCRLFIAIQLKVEEE